MVGFDLDFEDEKLWGYLRLFGCLSDRHKLLYIATPKVACTSLKWWFADLEGYSDALSTFTESDESSPELVIHDGFLVVAPNVAGLTAEKLEIPLRSDEYFRFAVVRNPYKRIFSAWQSKLLLREPLQSMRYLNCDFYRCPVGRTADGIAFAFESFLEHLFSEESPDFWDIHWTPQATLLRPDLISYTKLAQIENTQELSAALSNHLGPGIPNPFATRTSNESLIPYSPDFITDRAAELIRALYRQDFEMFAYSDRKPEASSEFSADQLRVSLKAVELIRARHQRLFEIRANHEREVVTLNGQISNLLQESTGLSGRIAALNHQVVSLNDHIANLNDQIPILNQAVALRDGQIAALLNSRSWRLTKPLRALWRYFV